MDSTVFEVCRLIAVVISMVLAYYIIPVCKIAVQKYVDENITGFVSSCVYAAQQTIKDNHEKKQYVLEQVTTWLNERGISITDAQLDILIESAVLAMKTETR